MWPTRSTTVGKRKQQQKSPQRTRKTHNEDYYGYYGQRNQGLPNMGNTCFLNSAIQFLYSSTQFRQAMFQLHGPQQSFESYIEKIFICIHYECTHYQKRQILDGIIKLMKENNLNFEKYTQQDCFQFILFILDNIGENYPEILSLFKLYYKLVCSNCHDTIKRKDYMIFNQYVICQKCKQCMEIKFISVPKCIILSGTNQNKKEVKVKTVEDKQIWYKLKANVIYSGNGRYGHYQVSRRKDDSIDKFYTFSDSYVVEDRSSYYSYYDRYYEKVLLCLYENDDKPEEIQIQPPIFKPLETNQMNVQLSDIYTNQSISKPKPQIKQMPVSKQNQRVSRWNPPSSIPKKVLTKPFEQQSSFDFKFFFTILGLQPLESLIRAYSNIKSLTTQIRNLAFGKSKLVQEVRSVLYNLPSIKNYSDSRVKGQTGYLSKYLIKQYNEKTQILAQQIREKLSFCKEMRKGQQTLKLVMFVTFSNLLASELPIFKDSFKFIFKYDCIYCGKFTSRTLGYFITNSSYFCCQKQIDFKRFYFERKPTYLIYINDMPTQRIQPIYEFNCVNVGYPLQYCQKGVIRINSTSTFQICEENIFKVQMSRPNSYSRIVHTCKNLTIMQLSKKMKIDIRQCLEMTKNKVKINQKERRIDYKSLQIMEIEQIKHKPTNSSRDLWIDYPSFNINVTLLN